MEAVSTSNFNIRELIEQESIEIHFQPIASIRRGTIVGVEALSRGLDRNHQRIPPMNLFSQAAAQGLTLELDRLCRRKAVESFLQLHETNSELILFVNFHATAIEEVAVGNHSFLKLVQRLNLDPQNVAIEILESEFDSATQWRTATERNKQSGFLMVLDDIGAGHSNLDRVIYVKPDILKADRSLVAKINNDYYKQEVLRSLIQLSERIGGWLIVEGVEQQEEAICALDLGADMLQGFYFARPQPLVSNDSRQWNLHPVQDTSAKFKIHTLEKLKTSELRHQQRTAIAKEVTAQLASVGAESFEHRLSQLSRNYPMVESFCVLDTSGIQVTETVCNPRSDEVQKTIIFKPPAKGTNHSFKEYYYLLTETEKEEFETLPYVPLPSSDLCITVSALFQDCNHQTFILCLHMFVAHT